MEQTTAWILDIGRNINVAIGKYEMVHLIENPTLVTAEPTPGPYCAYSLEWQGEQIPVADIAASLKQNTSDSDNNKLPELVAIVAYQEGESTLPKYGGIILNKIPDRQLVSNNQACALPEPHDNWLNVAISCFSDNGRSTPVLDLPWIFSQ